MAGIDMHMAIIAAQNPKATKRFIEHIIKQRGHRALIVDVESVQSMQSTRT